jgi:hypothetical protein
LKFHREAVADDPVNGLMTIDEHWRKKEIRQQQHFDWMHPTMDATTVKED